MAFKQLHMKYKQCFFKIRNLGTFVHCFVYLHFLLSQSNKLFTFNFAAPAFGIFFTKIFRKIVDQSPKVTQSEYGRYDKMAEDEAKTVDMPKEILAPPEKPREDMISTAVKFLQNPKVRTSPLQQRKAFLERKGLSKEEIDMAVARSGVTEEVTLAAPSAQNTVIPYSSSVPGPQVYQQLAPYSRWSRVRDVLSIIALAGGLSYAAYRFYKEVIRPLLFGKSKEEDKLEKMDRTITELQQSIVTTLTKVQESLAVLQGMVTKQDENLLAISREVYNKQSSETLSRVQDSQFSTEIKSELTSIKGLLLNRRQFPPTPSSTPVLPAWQLTTSSPGITTPTKTLVTPGGDGEISEDAHLNSNEKGKSEGDPKPVEIQYSATSLDDNSSPEKASQNLEMNSTEDIPGGQEEDEEVD
ncbi:peroxisomal membrane protein PEX14-like [Ostrea edulis]|uniref:peroxisomal membrane protein PEX14-like n=1 Tax=Ostrea edulis TaxID=37623 RepID=UPI0020940536|nr:peroxisomal membrane protein PEX14-like [Ostrea edulis]